MAEGNTFKRCSCREANRKELGQKCQAPPHQRRMEQRSRAAGTSAGAVK